VLVLGGDITGKLLIPLVDQGQGRYRYHWLDRDVVTDLEGIAAAEREIRAAAAYSFRTDPEQLIRIQADPDLASEVFVVAMAEVAKQWVALAEERLRGRDVECYIAPGNDDDFGIDEVLGNSDVVRNPEGEVIALRNAVEMIATGYSNPTPWDTPREEPEEALLARIRAMAERVRNLSTAACMCPRMAVGWTRPHCWTATSSRRSRVGWSRSARLGLPRCGMRSSNTSQASLCTATSTSRALSCGSGGPAASIRAANTVRACSAACFSSWMRRKGCWTMCSSPRDRDE
jgi:Icc-related predicted phosphoesterase